MHYDFLGLLPAVGAVMPRRPGARGFVSARLIFVSVAVLRNDCLVQFSTAADGFACRSSKARRRETCESSDCISSGAAGARAGPFFASPSPVAGKPFQPNTWGTSSVRPFRILRLPCFLLMLGAVWNWRANPVPCKPWIKSPESGSFRPIDPAPIGQDLHPGHTLLSKKGFADYGSRPSASRAVRTPSGRERTLRFVIGMAFSGGG